MDITELYKIFQQHPVVTTDSRDCPEGSIFFALKGESFDGNKFAAAALDKGCAYAVVDEAEYAVEGDPRFILTDNCLHTLQQLALHHRRTLGTKIIGITGTNGKTTTKELLAAVLGERYNVLFTQGNFNNDIGVPKTLLRLTKDMRSLSWRWAQAIPATSRLLSTSWNPTVASSPTWDVLTFRASAPSKGW